MVVTLPNKNIDGFSLFAEGAVLKNYFLPQTKEHILIFNNDCILTLFYTYPHHRRLYVVYIDKTRLLPRTNLPCVKSPVNILYKARGKKIDTLKYFLYLFKNKSKDYLFYPILFYQKLCTIVETNKKVSRSTVNALLKNFDLGELDDKSK